MYNSLRSSIRFILALAPLLILTDLAAQNHEFSPGTILVKFKERPQSHATVGLASSVGIRTIDALNRKFSAKTIRPLLRHRTTTVPDRRRLSLTNIVAVTFTKGVDLTLVLQAYQRDPNVEYAQPNFVHRLDVAPNDPRFPDQTALSILNAEAAWDSQLASPEIIVGVIDTGIDYRHEDLEEAIWINVHEDLNDNGKVDSTDFNGLDDDGNGFVDDLRGWDFTDAPAFPDGGDFMTPDNDPFDENGHGTSVAGLIGATGNNQKGIAGLAYGCRLMTLRAGTSLGFLEEDDVASAIVYAVENGARIINMSFGDEVASPLLQDVMAYATSQGVVLVASAGNANTDKLHFPSGFAETISVGATDLVDNLAGFSNFGSSVDLVAPGVNVLTTTVNNQYGGFSGTSASAPLISAIAALVLSKSPLLSPESVKGVLTSSTDDLGEFGWDVLFAAGRANAFRAVSSSTYSVARIIAPAVDQGFAEGPIKVIGTAYGAFLQRYIIELGGGETPQEWTEFFGQTNRQVVDQELTQIEMDDLEDGPYTLRLRAQNKDGSSVEDKVRFFIDRSPPVISDVSQTLMLDAARPSFLVEFDTDDVCDATIHFRPRGALQDFQAVRLRFRARNHRFHFTQDLAIGEIEYFIETRNGAGLGSIDDNSGSFFAADLSSPPIGGIPVNEAPRMIPSGFLLAKPADFDNDGQQEVVLNEYDASFNFGPLKILEAGADQFDEFVVSDEVVIPRDWGDSDGDGRLEILAGAGGTSFIFEASAPNAFPTEIVWSAANNTWASRFADLDRDGKGELILRLDELFTVWESTADNQYTLVDSFPNPTDGSNFVGVPKSEIGDFDGDGQIEILFGDLDGDVYLYEKRGDNRYEFTWSERQPLVDTIDYLSQGDYDGDGVAEFVVGCHSDPSLNVESEFDSRYWLYRIYRRTQDNSFAVVWEQAFFGFQSPADFDTGVSSGDVDNDGRPEILLSLFPDFYLVDYSPDLAAYQVIWHATPSRSNATLVADFTRNGTREFYYNDGGDVVGRELASDFNGPPSPVFTSARPLDSNLVQLRWQPASSPNGFRIYRASGSENAIPLAIVEQPPFQDETVQAGILYGYRVAALDSTKTPPESLPSPATKVTPGAKPFVERAEFIHPNQVRVVFSEAMDQQVKNQNRFEISRVGRPSSAIPHRSGKEVILTSPTALATGFHSITVSGVTDLDGTPLDTLRNSASFEVTTRAPSPYLVSGSLKAANQLRLEFSEVLDAASATQIDNYLIEPDVEIAHASLDTQDPKVVILEIDASSPIGPFGREYLITVSNIKSQGGAAITLGQGDAVALIFSNTDLSNVFAYPNPYRGASEQDFVTIAGLTPEATIRILDTSGRLVRTLEETDGNGGVAWDLKDNRGNDVASGIFLFYVAGAGNRAVGKVAVVR